MFGKVTHIKKHSGGEQPKKGDGTGFGFIEELTTKTGYFFHKNRVQGDFDALEVGSHVEFNAEPSDRGPRACDVRLFGLDPKQKFKDQ